MQDGPANPQARKDHSRNHIGKFKYPTWLQKPLYGYIGAFFLVIFLYLENGSVILRVYNVCLALDPEHVEKLFLPFYRAPGVEYSSIRGWGLGLTISKEIIERHKGQIWAEVAPRGLNILVKLPLSSFA